MAATHPQTAAAGRRAGAATANVDRRDEEAAAPRAAAPLRASCILSEGKTRKKADRGGSGR
jgi:hypothetical protein